MLGKIQLLLAIILQLTMFVRCNDETLSRKERALLWPPSSTYQLAMALVTPIWVEHKIFINVGFNVNYDLPSKITQFTKPGIFPGIFGRSFDSNQTTPANKYSESSRIKRDMSAGEVYSYLEEILSLHGHHSDCLLHMVCELAKVPFHMDHQDDNLLQEIIHLVLTPSLHQAFEDNEQTKKSLFENAEKQGMNEENCLLLYPMCDTLPMDDLTNVLEQ